MKKFILLICIFIAIMFTIIPMVFGFNKFDGKLNAKTPNGYTYFKVLNNNLYNGINAKTACPKGTFLPEIEDLMAVYCEIKGPNANYRIGSKDDFKSCSGHLYNNILATKIQETYGNQYINFWSSTHYYNRAGDDEGIWAVTIYSNGSDGMFVNIADAEYNIICLGK